MHVVTTKREYKDRVYTTHLLRRSYRDGATVKNETLGNLSHLPRHLIDLIRRALKGEVFAPVTAQFEILASAAQGHIAAVRTAMQRLGFDALIAARPSRERDLVVAMVVARIVAPHTKLATTRWWHTTTLAADLGVRAATEDDLYRAMDWLRGRQGAIEKKLAARHLALGSLVLYDLTSSYFEGTTCPLAAWGHNRDGKKGKLQVNYGLLTDRRGCPVAVSVFPGNTGDAPTLLPEVQRVRERFGVEQLVVVGDRGMISQTQITALQTLDGVAWITALKTGQIRALVDGGQLQLGLFDERNLFELSHPDFPGERLVACRNPELAKLRAHKRQALLAATVKELEQVKGMVTHGRLRGQDRIGVRVGKVINKYKLAKHFGLDIQEDRFEFRRLEDHIVAEAALDGIYIVRTSLPPSRMTAAETVLTYKSLSQVERAFRTLKTIDLHVRPIHHRLAERVRSHIFLCMLAYYVEWHMREAWRSLLFSDEDLEAKTARDPVAPAKRSAAADKKAATHTLEDGTPAHSFRTLLEELATIVRNTCRTPGGGHTAPTFEIVTTPSLKQRGALDLLATIVV